MNQIQKKLGAAATPTARMNTAIRSAYRRLIGRDANVSDVPLMLLRMLGGEHVTVQTKAGFPILIDSKDRYGAFNLWRTRVYNAEETAFFIRFARPGLRVVDVGANIGYFSVLLGRAAGATGKVLAFEPSSETAAICRSNLALNGLLSSVELREAAAGEESSAATLYIDRDHSSNNALYDHMLGGTKAREARQVEVVRVDDVASTLWPVDILKVDVEGAELHALRGARETLRASPAAVLLCEVAPRWLQAAGHAPKDLLDEIATHGFEAYEVVRGGELIPIDPYERAVYFAGADKGGNFCFIRPPAVAEFVKAGRLIVRPAP